MLAVDLSFGDPLQELACDEVLLELSEEGGLPPLLRFWEPDRAFAVLGCGSRPGRELDGQACRQGGLPVFRRASGGGTVLQAPGCLNYALVLPLEDRPEWATAQAANRSIMKRHQEALGRLLDGEVRIQGLTDLTLRGRKFSGNAQRRRRSALLFHGTFLYQMDLRLMDRFLSHPPRAPEYRSGRPHSRFTCNLPLSPQAVRTAIGRAWSAGGSLSVPELASRVRSLARRKREDPRWHPRDPGSEA